MKDESNNPFFHSHRTQTYVTLASSPAAEDWLPIMSAVVMRFVLFCLAAWATVSQTSSNGLGTLAGTEESQQHPGITSHQSRDVDNDVDPFREQKPQKWAFMPHNPSGFGDKFVANHETGESASNSQAEDFRAAESDSTEAFTHSDRSNVHHQSQSLYDNGDPVISSDNLAVDDRTLLDVFAESAKEYLTTRLVSGLELES
jgi:hypothetical protein